MKVLVVDDEAIIRKGISTLLQEQCTDITQCLEAGNGKAALEYVEVQRPDLIITDIRMPVMDGLELSKTIHERYPHIAIVILTGYADFGYAQQALKFGVVDYLLKPVTKEKLNEIMLKMLLNTPDAWTTDVSLVRVMKETVTQLTRSVLAERQAEAEALLDQWKDFCLRRKLTLLELKQLMSHFYVAYSSELLFHMPSTVEEELKLKHTSTSADALFEDWKLFLQEQILTISEKRAPRNKRVVDSVISVIEENYHQEHLNIHYLAEISGVTTAYLSKMFREIMNQPITQYISEYRLERARRLLESNEEEKISAIAEQCGFNDYPYFSKVFKRSFGVSPLEYRDKNLS